VCGSDGSTYRSLCLLEQTSCQEERNITAVYYGRCHPGHQDNATELEYIEGPYSQDGQITCLVRCSEVAAQPT
jgi:hypothetical protein